MIKSTTHENIFDYFYGLENDYRKSFDALPNISIRIFEGFIWDFENANDFVLKSATEFESVLKNMVFSEVCNMYLCMLYTDFSRSKNIRDYFKVWKNFKEDSLDDFNLGYEYKVPFKGESTYCGMAKFKVFILSKALRILCTNKSNSFIYVSSNDNLTSNEETVKFYNLILEDAEKYSTTFTIFNFINLYNKMDCGDAIIRLVSDGEMLSMFIIQKHSESLGELVQW
ncbi:hypothetical protein AGMMS49975_21990 [Clostridia bacterium]|nr:hypothetical protein AGMMS49975_21990 [Clostridia bacterium]